MFAVIRQWWCEVQGHEDVKTLEKGEGSSRMFLRCLNCGRETPGISIPNLIPVKK